MKNNITLLIFFVFVFNACDKEEYQATYIIENATDHNVQVKFYNRMTGNGEPLLVDVRSINGQGLLYKESKTLVGVTSRQVPQDVYGADSIALIFDDQLVQSHYDGLPLERSLAFFSDYIHEENDDVYRYVITEENYENALDCNGNCQ